LLGELKTLKESVKKFEGIDVEDLRSKASSVENLKQELERAKKDNSSDEKVEELRKSLEAEVQKERDKLNSFVNKYRESKIESLITDSVAKHKGVSELLKPVIRNRLKDTVTDDGDVQIEVLSKDGKPYFIDGNEATVEDLVKELKADEIYSRCFEGTGASGSGTRPTNGKLDFSLDPTDPNYSLTEAMRRAAKRK